MKYSVISVIVTYNRCELLKECISAVQFQTIAFDKIIIVDNCSTDGTSDYLSNIRGSNVVVFRSDVNLGGAWGFYKGMELANEFEYDYVLLIDDDAILRPSFLKEMIDGVDFYPTYAAYSSSVYVDGAIDVGHRRDIKHKLFGTFEMIGESRYKKDECFECDTATFCGLLIKSSVVKKIGLPKKEYFIWYDDVEYSLRMKKYGGILNINKAILDHKTEKSFTLKEVNWKTYYGERNYLDVVFTHFGIFPLVISFLRKICKLLIAFFKNERENGYNVSTLYFDAYRDFVFRINGVNEKYLPKKR